MQMPTSMPGLCRSADDRALETVEALLEAERTERERLQRELDLRNCALDSASTYFLILDVTGASWKIDYANRAVALDHGYEQSQLLGENPAKLTVVAKNKLAFARLGKAVREGGSARAELVSRHKGGSSFWSGILLTPLRHGSDGASRYLAIGTDITMRLEQQRRQRQLQEQLLNEMKERERIGIELRLAQKLESVGRLAAGIAHEINTPVQYIGDSVLFLQSAFSDLDQLRVACLNAFQQPGESEPSAASLARVAAANEAADLAFLTKEVPLAFHRAMQGVERVAAIVRAMKEFAHPDSIEQAPADLNHAIKTTLLVAHNEYKYTAQIEMHLGELPEVICNIGELNQVFLNLIVNAAHAIADSGKDVQTGRIIITTSAVGEDVQIGVVDNGCGIPQENLDKIFDQFFTTKAVGRGTGQGLAITRAIVTEKHGGSIDVHSVVGSGSRFTLRLPIAGRRQRGSV
jgi:PAS domain S-box-containing protein